MVVAFSYSKDFVIFPQVIYNEQVLEGWLYYHKLPCLPCRSNAEHRRDCAALQICKQAAEVERRQILTFSGIFLTLPRQLPPASLANEPAQPRQKHLAVRLVTQDFS